MADRDIDLLDLSVTINGKEVHLKVSQDIYQKAIQDDQATLELICASVGENSSKEQCSQGINKMDSGLSNHNQEDRQQSSLNQEDSVLCQDEGEQESMEQENENTDVSTGFGGTKWTHDSIKLMLALYAENKDKFASSVYRNKDVWKKIATEMRVIGYLFTAECCDKKFRLLKHRHKVITDINSKSGRGTSRWEWYELMDELLTGDPAIKPVRVVSSTEGFVSSNIQVQVCVLEIVVF
ncbi:hypothetical protein ACF0H5_001208 [Mactra antiquata]